MLNKIFFIFMLLILVARPSFAQEEKKFTEIEAGATAPYSGYLFTKSAVAKIYTTIEEKEKEKDIVYGAKINLLNLDIKNMQEVHRTELKNKDLLFQNVVNEKNITIGKLNSQVETTQWIIIGSFIAGTLLGGFIVGQIATGF